MRTDVYLFLYIPFVVVPLKISIVKGCRDNDIGVVILQLVELFCWYG